MQKAISVFICLFIITTGFSQSSEWIWASNSYGAYQQAPYAIATNGENVYTTGLFNGLNATFGTQVLLNGGNSNFFIAKYTIAGDVIWARGGTVKGLANIVGTSVAVDGDGNVYVAGYLTGDSVFIENYMFSSANSTTASIFIAKYDSLGNVLWTKNINGNYRDVVNGIALDRNNNLYIAGFFQSDSIAFGPYTFYNPGAHNGQLYNLFLAKYSSTGQVLWAKSAGLNTSETIEAQSVATDINSNVYITGNFQGDSIALGNVTLSGKNSAQSIFIAKYDSVGNLLLKNQALSDITANSLGLGIDKKENIYITGSFNGDFIFDSDTLFGRACSNIMGNTYCNPQNFIAKYDMAGNIVWAYNTGGQDGAGTEVAVDSNGNVSFLGSSSLGPITFGSLNLNVENGSYFVTYDINGQFICNDKVDYGPINAMCVDNNGNTYIAGFFDEDPFVIGDTTLYLNGSHGNQGFTNAFVAKYNCTLPSGIENIAENYSLQLYPNPFSNHTTVQYSLPPNSKNASLIIYDILGSTNSSYHLNNSGEQVEVDGNSLNNGIYFYSLVVDGRTLTTNKMIVQK